MSTPSKSWFVLCSRGEASIAAAPYFFRWSTDDFLVLFGLIHMNQAFPIECGMIVAKVLNVKSVKDVEDANQCLRSENDRLLSDNKLSSSMMTELQRQMSEKVSCISIYLRR